MKMYYDLMLFFWHLSEKHWLLKPFEWLGNWMEDYGLDHGHIRFNDDIMARIEEARKERSLEISRRVVRRYKSLGDLLAEEMEE